MFNVNKIKQILKEKHITQRQFYNDLKLPNRSEFVFAHSNLVAFKNTIPKDRITNNFRIISIIRIE